MEVQTWPILLALTLPLAAQSPNLDFLNHNRPVLDAHNCYPYSGKWTDRLARALSTGYPVAIEQDLAWSNERVVVSHEAHTTGAESTLKEHFFDPVRPLIEKALKENNTETWPIIILHFDFKDNQPQLLHAVWDLLGQYEDWITTAPNSPDKSRLMPMHAKPILVLTEDNDAQEQVFFTDLKPNQNLRLFGSAHTAAIPGHTAQERMHAAATLPPDQLLTESPTNYRRWWNNSWYEVEEGGQPRAGDWTPAANQRLKALVDHAHNRGFWIRFYTLDGFLPAEDRGWGPAYNFRSPEAVQKRWRAAIDAGVNLIASDQYEDLAKEFKAGGANDKPK